MVHPNDFFEESTVKLDAQQNSFEHHHPFTVVSSQPLKRLQHFKLNYNHSSNRDHKWVSFDQVSCCIVRIFCPNIQTMHTTHSYSVECFRICLHQTVWFGFVGFKGTRAKCGQTASGTRLKEKQTIGQQAKPVQIQIHTLLWTTPSEMFLLKAH